MRVIDKDVYAYIFNEIRVYLNKYYLFIYVILIYSVIGNTSDFESEES